MKTCKKIKVFFVPIYEDCFFVLRTKENKEPNVVFQNKKNSFENRKHALVLVFFESRTCSLLFRFNVFCVVQNKNKKNQMSYLFEQKTVLKNCKQTE